MTDRKGHLYEKIEIIEVRKGSAFVQEILVIRSQKQKPTKQINNRTGLRRSYCRAGGPRKEIKYEMGHTQSASCIQ